MTPERAAKILQLLGYSAQRPTPFLREVNRIARTRYTSCDAWRWFNGQRDLPLGVAIFLRLAVRLARVSRVFAGERAEMLKRFENVLRRADDTQLARLAQRLALMEDHVGVTRDQVEARANRQSN